MFIVIMTSCHSFVCQCTYFTCLSESLCHWCHFMLIFVVMLTYQVTVILVPVLHHSVCSSQYSLEIMTCQLSGSYTVILSLLIWAQVSVCYIVIHRSCKIVARQLDKIRHELFGVWEFIPSVDVICGSWLESV